MQRPKYADEASAKNPEWLGQATKQIPHSPSLAWTTVYYGAFCWLQRQSVRCLGFLDKLRASEAASLSKIREELQGARRGFNR